jgi:hypothetical protein
MDYLTDVPIEDAFILGDIKILSLSDLSVQLKKMDSQTYSHYANKNHNYFADWVLHVVKHNELANKLINAKDLAQAQKAIEESLKKKTTEEIQEKPVASLKEKKITPVKKTEFVAPDKIADISNLESEELIKRIAMDESEIKHFLWKHYSWHIAKEFIYGFAIGIICGLILSKVF